MTDKEKASKTLHYLKKVISKLPKGMVLNIVTLFYMMKSKEVGFFYKATIVAALAYFVSPIDGIPDAIPGAGFTDDLSIVVGAIKLVKNHHKYPEFEQTAKNYLENEGWLKSPKQ